MKKTIVIVICMMIFLFIYFLQSNFFVWFNISGIKPSVYVIFVLWIGLFMGRRWGFPLGIFFGLLLDILSARIVGIYAIMLGVIGLIGGYVDKKFSKESKITIILGTIFLTILYETGVLLANKILWKSILENSFFIRTVIVEALFNATILIILYPGIKKAGYYVESIFRGSNILTRYF